MLGLTRKEYSEQAREVAHAQISVDRTALFGSVTGTPTAALQPSCGHRAIIASPSGRYPAATPRSGQSDSSSCTTSMR
ncbi:MAG: hypothetical protein K2Q97_08015, partial [Burkholderiaceae bacterium]|nr:hypothetical protein [Burkholderiaceae bacterium]